MSKSKKNNKKYSKKLKRKYSKKIKRKYSKKLKIFNNREQIGCQKQSGGNGPNIFNSLGGFFDSISYSFDQFYSNSFGTQSNMSNPDPLEGNFQRN